MMLIQMISSNLKNGINNMYMDITNKTIIDDGEFGEIQC